jgi:hypothetical protein
MKVFLTFANLALIRSLKRLSKQAQALNYYDKIYTYSELDLSDEFREKYGCRLVDGSRGYGYWCWKSQIICQVLEGLSEGDVVQYTDAGCHLNAKGIERLDDYFSLAEKSLTGILAFQLKDPDYMLPKPVNGALDLREFKWVKGDLLDYFEVRNRLDITQTQTIGAGVIFIRKCAQSVALIKQWRSVVEANFSYIDDSPSVSPNLPGFIEHRHDQAIFSLLCKLNGVDTVSAYEYWYPSAKGSGADWGILERFPIHAKRDKDFGMVLNLKILCGRIYSKMKRVIFRRCVVGS